MNSRIINLVFALGVLALFQGCASGTTTTTENTLDQKVAAEQKVGTTKKLADLENSHIQIIFDAVDQANVILGRDALKNQEVVDSFFERHNHLD